jgi:predicted nuclease of predicted toxin-antitoxin system
MKLLLDENLPVKLKYRFIDNGIDSYTVKDMNWLGKANGELLNLMLQNNFTSFLTIDNNLAFQQNFNNYPLQVVVIIAPDNTYQTIMEIFHDIITSIKSQSEKITSVIHPAYSAH